MPRSEQFPEPLSEGEFVARIQKQQFPNPTNLNGKGYLQFLESLPSETIEERLAYLRRKCYEGLSRLKDFEGDVTSEARDRAIKASKCLQEFVFLFQVLNNHLRSPKDIEHVFEDTEFSEKFAELVRCLRKSDIFSFYEWYIKTQAHYSTETQRTEAIMGLGEYFKMFMQADIYLASRLDKR